MNSERAIVLAQGDDDVARRRWQQGELDREGRYWKVRYYADYITREGRRARRKGTPINIGAGGEAGVGSPFQGVGGVLKETKSDVRKRGKQGGNCAKG